MTASAVEIGGAAAVTFMLLFPVRAILRRMGVVDRPNARSSHQVATIRGAGVAMVAVVAAFLGGRAISAPLLWVVTAGFLVLALVSFVDDLKGLPARVRFAVHVTVAFGGLAAVLGSRCLPIQLGPIVFVGISWLWVTGYTNAFNFMDGINGIAAIQTFATGLGTALVAIAAGLPNDHAAVVLGLVVSGVALGFLPHNFPRAYVFMGDVGSAPLGFMLALLAIWVAAETSWWMLFWLGLLHANFVLDTGITLVRRARRKDRLSQPHREHFYQRLVRAGQSHTRVTLTEGALQVPVVIGVWYAVNATFGLKIAVSGGILMMWLTFFGYAERTFRRSELAVPQPC